MPKPLVSVIVPVYNAADYVDQTLESIFMQTMGDFEVICVDDGSTDGSGELLDKAAREHDELQVIHQANGGVSRARNAGISHASGMYLQFVDGDDQIAPDLLEHAVRAARQHQAQMTIFGFDEFYGEPSNAVPRELCPDASLYEEAFALKDISGLCTEVTTPNVWRILYDHEFVEASGVTFHEDLRAAEDLAFIYETMLQAERIILVGERPYHYRRDNASSLTRGNRSTTGLRALAHIKRFADERGLLAGPLAGQFVNLVLDTVQYGLWSAAGREEYDHLYEAYQRGWRGFVDDHSGAIAPRYQEFYDSTACNDAEGYLFELYRQERSAAEQARA